MEKKKSRGDGEIKKEEKNKKERETFVLSEPVQAGCFDWCSSACGSHDFSLRWEEEIAIVIFIITIVFLGWSL